MLQHIKLFLSFHHSTVPMELYLHHSIELFLISFSSFLKLILLLLQLIHCFKLNWLPSWTYLTPSLNWSSLTSKNLISCSTNYGQAGSQTTESRWLGGHRTARLIDINHLLTLDATTYKIFFCHCIICRLKKNIASFFFFTLSSQVLPVNFSSFCIFILHRFYLIAFLLLVSSFFTGSTC